MFQQGIGFALMIIMALFAAAAFSNVISVIFPRKIEAVAQGWSDINARTFWLGVVNTILLAVPAIVLLILGANIGEWFAVPSVLLVTFYVGVGLFSLIGLVHFLGRRLFPDASSFRQNTYAAILLILAVLTPFVGWYLLLPFLLIYGFGGSVERFFQRRRTKRNAREGGI
ncbi:MAG: hypothetical protein IIC78_15070 [Chloroflexi bacterium]|nr:hypothetical protein [Chloroflexota bacterium]